MALPNNTIQRLNGSYTFIDTFVYDNNYCWYSMGADQAEGEVVEYSSGVLKILLDVDPFGRPLNTILPTDVKGYTYVIYIPGASGVYKYFTAYTFSIDATHVYLKFKFGAPVSITVGSRIYLVLDSTAVKELLLRRMYSNYDYYRPATWYDNSKQLGAHVRSALVSGENVHAFDFRALNPVTKEFQPLQEYTAIGPLYGLYNYTDSICDTWLNQGNVLINYIYSGGHFELGNYYCPGSDALFHIALEGTTQTWPNAISFEFLPFLVEDGQCFGIAARNSTTTNTVLFYITLVSGKLRVRIDRYTVSADGLTQTFIDRMADFYLGEAAGIGRKFIKLKIYKGGVTYPEYVRNYLDVPANPPPWFDYFVVYHGNNYYGLTVHSQNSGWFSPYVEQPGKVWIGGFDQYGLCMKNPSGTYGAGALVLSYKADRGVFYAPPLTLLTNLYGQPASFPYKEDYWTPQGKVGVPYGDPLHGRAVGKYTSYTDAGHLGDGFYYPYQAWGGNGSVVWYDLLDGTLPPGLVWENDGVSFTGRIVGLPVLAGTWRFRIKCSTGGVPVERVQEYILNTWLNILP